MGDAFIRDSQRQVHQLKRSDTGTCGRAVKWSMKKSQLAIVSDWVRTFRGSQGIVRTFRTGSKLPVALFTASRALGDQLDCQKATELGVVKSFHSMTRS